MTLPDVHKNSKLDYLVLLLISALAFYIAFILYHNYSYPLLAGEWIHLSFSKAPMKAGSFGFSGSFLLATALFACL